MNPFQGLYDGCNVGTNAAKYADLPPFPRLMDIEVTSACNFRCLMCPTGNLSVTRPTGFMDPDLFKKLVDECTSHSTALRFIGWGEPTLHPSLVSFVTMANRAGLLTHVNTNGSKLTPGLAQRLIDSGLNSLKFSFQGTDRKSYRDMRGTDFFDGLLKVAAMVRDLRGTRPLPYLHLSTTVTYETGEQVAEFRKRAEPLVDAVTVGTTTFDFMDLNAVRLRPSDLAKLKRLKLFDVTRKQHPDPCPEVNDKLSIHWDGSVMVCCNAFDKEGEIGKFPEQSLTQLWRGKVMEDYRKRLAKDEYSGPLCSVCYDYMALTEQESD